MFHPRIRVEYQAQRTISEHAIRRVTSGRKTPSEEVLRKKSVADAQVVNAPPPIKGVYTNEGWSMPLYHLWTRQEVLEFAKLSNFDEGLSSTEAAKRLLANGLNEIKPKERAVIWKILSLLFGGFNAVLYVASLITWIAWRPLGDPNPAPANLALAIILIIVALINSGFQWFQQRSSSNVMQSIRTMVPASARVKRDGAFKDVPVSEVVLGDVVEVKGGDRVPADLRLLQTSGTRMDLSALTGETEPIRSTTFNTSANYMESRNIAFLGTHALEGSAVGVVVATGDQSVMCRIAQSASAMPVEDSYLVRQVRRLVHVIATMAAFS